MNKMRALLTLRGLATLAVCMAGLAGCSDDKVNATTDPVAADAQDNSEGGGKKPLPSDDGGDASDGGPSTSDSGVPSQEEDAKSDASVPAEEDAGDANTSADSAVDAPPSCNGKNDQGCYPAACTPKNEDGWKNPCSAQNLCRDTGLNKRLNIDPNNMPPLP